jgi:hypothetical protein
MNSIEDIPIPPEKANLSLGSRFTSSASGTVKRYAISTSPFFSMAVRVVASGMLLKTSRFT